MPAKKVTDPEAVRRAIAEHDAIGEAAFLEKYRFGTAKRLSIVLDGRRYASKAIYGVAHQHQHGSPLTSADFTGGLQSVVVPLKAMGFEVSDEVSAARSPTWSRDELILVMDLYRRMGGDFPGMFKPYLIRLTEQLNKLHHALGTNEGPAPRDPDEVELKLLAFRRFDPRPSDAGQASLTRGNKLEQEVWDSFRDSPARLHAVAQAIRSNLDGHPPGNFGIPSDPLLSGIEEAPEGRILTVMHLRRERSRELMQSKKARVLHLAGRLACEACAFDFAGRYGQRGEGFIECHHTRPIETLSEGHRTRLQDLALLCANCHRMIHAKRPWISVEELRNILRVVDR